MVALDHVECVVVGGGVVGLAVARRLAEFGREVVVLEQEPVLGMHTSSRNSEVIHAGIYYPNQSLKAKLCVEGGRRLYTYCEEKRVPHCRIGKIVVAACESDVPAVQSYFENAQRNGVTDLRWLDRNDIHELEPAVEAVSGFLSSATGIVDSHAYMLALQADAERFGAQFIMGTPVTGGELDTRGIIVETGGGDPSRILCDVLVNSGGLFAQSVARRFRGFPDEHIPPIYYAKGHYFELATPSPFRRLVYPKTSGGGLGVHVTLDLAGRARFGPDATVWPESIDYGFDCSLESGFYEAIRRYYPGLQDGSLRPAYTGIRPKLAPKGSPDSDFVIFGPLDHGIQGMVHLFGIESPGLTASLAIADVVAKALFPSA